MSTDTHKLVTTSARWPIRSRALWAPILVLELYLAFTVFIFFFGPVDWDLPSAPKLVIFLFVNYGGLWLGYRWGIRRGKRNLKQMRGSDTAVMKLPEPLMRLILFSMIFTISSTTLRLFAIRGGLEPILSTFLNPGEAYIQAQLLAQMDRDGLVVTPLENYSWAFRISTIFAVFNSLYFPVAIICWRQMSFAYRVLFFVAMFCSIAFTVGMGAQAGIGFMVFSLFPVALYKIYVAPKTSEHNRIGHRQTKAYGILIGISLFVLIATVVYFQLDRAETEGRDLAYDDALVGAYGSSTTRGFPLFGDGRVNYGVIMLCKYVSQGYAGLALSMELPFEWTYGLGWSKALQVILRDYLGGPDLFEQSYLARNEATSGWHALWWWSTIFPWIASDTTYFGTVFVMLLIGFAIGRLWINIIVIGNPIAFAVLAQMFTLVFMFPANNALAQTLEGLFSLIGVLIIFFMSGRYFKRRFNRKDQRITTIANEPA
jgi:hypothetical protein